MPIAGTYGYGGGPGGSGPAGSGGVGGANNFTPSVSRIRRTNNVATAQVQQLATQLADQIVREREIATIQARNGRVFTTFNPADDVLPNRVETVTRGLFSDGSGSMLSFFTSSTATTAQLSYFYELFDKDPDTVNNAAPMLSIAYGHFNGSGSTDTTGNLNNDTPSRAVYKQYAQTLLAPNDNKFTINGTDTDSIYALTFNRARFREKLDPGNFEINLSAPYISIIDDSSVSSATEGEAGKVYNLISGSIDGGTDIYNPTSPTYYGLLYPQHGIAILNADAINSAGVFTPATGTSEGTPDNRALLHTALKSGSTNAPAGKTGGIQARSSEQVKSTYFFVRVKNAEYNYSNNPSFSSGSLGALRYATFVNDPQVYITSVGLYNDRGELLAVAKLSQPLLKAFTREALIKVKLDF